MKYTFAVKEQVEEGESPLYTCWKSNKSLVLQKCKQNPKGHTLLL